MMHIEIIKIITLVVTLLMIPADILQQVGFVLQDQLVHSFIRLLFLPQIHVVRVILVILMEHYPQQPAA